VVSAIIKYHATERGRIVINDAMDVHGGKGICLGPDNYLGRFYQQTPIGITVEGANILTRTLMIFGQGAIRSIPMCSRRSPPRRTITIARPEAVRRGLFGHISFAMSNAVRSLCTG
jgi:acyl-CoA dehydrogenase